MRKASAFCPHQRFAGVHRVDDVQLSDAVVGHFEIDQDFGDDTDDPASVSKRRLSYGTHETYLGSAIDNADSMGSKRAAQILRSNLISRIGSAGGSTEDSNIAN